VIKPSVGYVVLGSGGRVAGLETMSSSVFLERVRLRGWRDTLGLQVRNHSIKTLWVNRGLPGHLDLIDWLID
jgi:hypothetical protein